MSSPHGDLGPELRRLAQVILDRLDPAVQAASAAAQGRGDPGRCQQVWCPVCALAALVAGEQHPLLTVIAEHSVSLMAVIGAKVADAERAADAQSAPPKPHAAGMTPPPPTGADPTPPRPGDRDGNGSGRYQHIPIVVEPVRPED